MENNMQKLANMLGVDLDEEFEVPEYPSWKFKITDDGMKEICDGCAMTTGGSVSLFVLEGLLTGAYTIKRKHWKPKDGYPFWYVNPEGRVRAEEWYRCDEMYMNFYKIGNCYRTSEEAEENSKKWKAFYASDEVLEV